MAVVERLLTGPGPSNPYPEATAALALPMLRHRTPMAAGKGDALVLADCVTSLAGIPVDIDGWDVDIAYRGTQRCVGVAPRLAPLAEVLGR